MVKSRWTRSPKSQHNSLPKLPGLELLLSWPVQEPADHGIILPCDFLHFLLMCTPVYNSTSNVTTAQDFGINKADWNSEFLYYNKEILILQVDFCCQSKFETKHVCHIPEVFWGFSFGLWIFLIETIRKSVVSTWQTQKLHLGNWEESTITGTRHWLILKWYFI